MAKVSLNPNDFIQFEKLLTKFSETASAINGIDESLNSLLKTANKAGDSMNSAFDSIADLKKFEKQFESTNEKIKDREQLLLDLAKIATETAKEQKIQADKEARISQTRLRRKEHEYKQRERAAKQQEKHAKEREKNAKQVQQEEEKARKEYERNTGTINQLNKRVSELTKSRKMLNLETKEGREEYEKQTKTLSDLIKQQKNFNEEIGRSQLNVGNYKDEVKQALEETGAFGGVLGEMRGAFQGVSQGVQSAKKAFGTLKGAIAATGIGLLLVAFGSLVTWFQKTEKGAKTLKVITAGLGAAMNFLTGIISKAGELIYKAFTSPKEVIIALGDAIKQNILNRFEAFAKMGSAVLKIFSKDWKQGLKDFGESTLQLVTGVENVTEKVTNFGNAIADSVNKAMDLERLRQTYQRLNRTIQKQVASLTGQLELQSIIAGDATISLEEQEEASLRVLELTEKKAAKELQLAQNNLTLLNKEIELRRSNGELIDDLLDQQTDAQVEVINLENQLTNEIRTNEQERRQIQQDRIERNLDDQIDLYDNQKTINERIIADETKAFEMRVELLNKTKKQADESFNAQIAEIQKLTGERINGNMLVAESDALVLSERIKSLGLSEIIETRLNEVIRERKTVTQDLYETERDLLQQNTEQLTAAFEEQQALALANFEAQEIAGKKSAKERKEFEIQQQQEALEFILGSGQKLSASQIQNAKNAIEVLKVELAELEEETIDNNVTASILGTTPEQIEKTKEQGAELISSLKSFASQALSIQSDRIDKEIAKQDELIASKQAEIDAEQEKIKALEAAGDSFSTAKLEQLQSEKEQEEQIRAEAIEKQKKAQLLQADIDAASQLSSVGVIIANIVKEWSKLGPLGATLGLVNAGISIAGIFAARKAARNQIKASNGLVMELDGASHSSGGVQLGESGVEAEGGEMLAIANRRETSRNGAMFTDFVNDFNKGEIDNFFTKYSPTDSGAYSGFVMNNSSADMSGVESKIDRTNTLLNESNNLAKNPTHQIKKGSIVRMRGIIVNYT